MRTKNGGGFDGDAEATAHISVKKPNPASQKELNLRYER